MGGIKRETLHRGITRTWKLLLCCHSGESSGKEIGTLNSNMGCRVSGSVRVEGFGLRFFLG